MKLLTAFFQLFASLVVLIGVLSIFKTIFDLHLRYKGNTLPNNSIGADALVVIGLKGGGIGVLLRKLSTGKREI